MKILIADDHALFRDGLRCLLEHVQDDTVVLEASTCRQALSISKEHEDIDLILPDLAMPDLNGFDAMAAIIEQVPAVPVAILSASENPVDMRRAYEEGAMGYIPKSHNNEIIEGAIRLMLSGGIYVPKAALGTSNMRQEGNEAVDGVYLTPQQKKVLMLMGQGKSNKHIARALNVAESTVKAHVSAILRSLNADNRTEAVIEAKKYRIL